MCVKKNSWNLIQGCKVCLVHCFNYHFKCVKLPFFSEVFHTTELSHWQLKCSAALILLLVKCMSLCIAVEFCILSLDMQIESKRQK